MTDVVAEVSMVVMVEAATAAVVAFVGTGLYNCLASFFFLGGGGCCNSFELLLFLFFAVFFLFDICHCRWR